MRIARALLAFAAAAGVTACPSNPPAATAASSTEAVALYQSAGSKQCERGGKSLDALRQELSASGVQVLSGACAHDGRMYAQACGTPDGRILVVRVPREQAAAAQRLGLRPLRELPDSVPVGCR